MDHFPDKQFYLPHHKKLALKNAEDLKKELNEINIKIKQKINSINQQADDKQYLIPLLNFETQVNAIERIISYFHNKIEKYDNEIIQIKDYFRDMDIDDVDYFLDQIQIYQEDINKCNRTIEKIKGKEQELNQIFPELSKIIEIFIKNIEQYELQITEKWISIKSKVFNNPEQKNIHDQLLDNIEIISEIYFDKKEFYNVIKESLNKVKFKQKGGQTTDQRIEEAFNVDDFNSYISLVRNEKLLTLEAASEEICLFEFLERNEYFNTNMDREIFKNFYKSHSIQKFCKVISKTRFQGKEIDSLSMGERGTLFLRLKLATAAFSIPFIFDQPEDDLDNDFIQNNLVPLFRKLKQYRQIIVVTHDANIVVNSNAEQVIIANNNNEVLSYISGGLEELYIRQKICDIL
ncbi:unnamed protein product, partial [marine sediment metagenome]